MQKTQVKQLLTNHVSICKMNYVKVKRKRSTTKEKEKSISEIQMFMIEGILVFLLYRATSMSFLVPITSYAVTK